MKRFSIRLLVALLTFIVGVAVGSVWSMRGRDQVKTWKHLAGPPCFQDVVSVDRQPNIPLQISLANTACYDHVTLAHFVVENTGSKTISRYEIRGIRTYERSIDTGLGVSTSGTTLEPHQLRDEGLGTSEGTVRGVPVGRLKSLRLSVWSIVYADGTTWTSLPD